MTDFSQNGNAFGSNGKIPASCFQASEFEYTNARNLRLKLVHVSLTQRPPCDHRRLEQKMMDQVEHWLITDQLIRNDMLLLHIGGNTVAWKGILHTNFATTVNQKLRDHGIGAAIRNSRGHLIKVGLPPEFPEGYIIDPYNFTVFNPKAVKHLPTARESEPPQSSAGATG